MALEEPFPAAPSRVAKYQVKVFRDGDMKALTLFCAKYAARHFIDAVIAEKKYEWIGDRRIEVELATGSIMVESDNLREIMDHRMTGEEKAWVLPRPYPNYAYQINHGVWQEKTARVEAEETKATAPSTKPVKRERVSKDGLVTLAEICAEIGVLAKDARAALRKSNIDKSPAGWAWKAEDVGMVKNEIIKAWKK